MSASSGWPTRWRANSLEITWTARYRTSAPFRHGMRVVTAAWGVALILDAVVRTVMAYTRQGLIGTRDQAVDAPASANKTG